MRTLNSWLTIGIQFWMGNLSAKFTHLLDKMHSWVKGIQVCSNEGTWPFPRRNHSTIVKMCWQYFKTSSQEWLDHFQSNFAQSIDPWVKRIQFCSSEGRCPFSRVINSDNKKHCHLLKFSLELLVINQALYRHPCMDGINFFYRQMVIPFLIREITNFVL